VHARLEARWRSALARAVAAEQARCLRHAPGLDRAVYGAYVLLLEPAALARIAVREALAGALGPTAGVPALRLALNVGAAVEHAVAASLAGAEDAAAARAAAAAAAAPADEAEAAGGAAAARRARAARARALRRPAVAAALAESAALEWPLAVRVKLGALLLEMLRRCALVHVDPATLRLAEEEAVSAEVVSEASGGARRAAKRGRATAVGGAGKARRRVRGGPRASFSRKLRCVRAPSPHSSFQPIKIIRSLRSLPARRAPGRLGRRRRRDQPPRLPRAARRGAARGRARGRLSRGAEARARGLCAAAVRYLRARRAQSRRVAGAGGQRRRRGARGARRRGAAAAAQPRRAPAAPGGRRARAAARGRL
jgi:hypothetical protein